MRARLEEILAFAGPALGMVLADPLMSLIDTACVGHVSAVELAALVPCTAVFNAAYALVSFLGVVTTTAVASRSGLSECECTAARQSAERMLSLALVTAALAGTAITAGLWIGGPALLMHMGADAAVLPPALSYLRIRALAAPAVTLGNVAMGVCLGQQDTRTPFLVFCGAGLLNLVGDGVLVFGCGMGVAGAAWATVGSQVASTVPFLLWLWRKGRASAHAPRLEWTGLPSDAELKHFGKARCEMWQEVAAAMVSRTIFGTATYTALAVEATGLGVTALAAHQVAMQVFWFVSYVPETLSLAGQSMIARDRRQRDASAAWARLLLAGGAALGLGLAAALAAMLRLGMGAIASDPGVVAAAAALWPTAAAAVLICSVMMVLDGISIGCGALRHLAPSNLAGLAATLCTLRVSPSHLSTVWAALVAFYATRTAGHVLYYACARPTAVFATDSGH